MFSTVLSEHKETLLKTKLIQLRLVGGAPSAEFRKKLALVLKAYTTKPKKQQQQPQRKPKRKKRRGKKSNRKQWAELIHGLNVEIQLRSPECEAYKAAEYARKVPLLGLEEFKRRFSPPAWPTPHPPTVA